MKIVLVGMGKSGLAAQRLCEAMGYEYVCIDRERSKGLPERTYVPDVDLYVLSPGVSSNHPQIKHAIQRNIPWIGEAAFALKHCKHTVIGVTGTNGKSTVTTLTAHVLPRAVACGNNGYPLSEALLDYDETYTLVAELSSYQLETMHEPVLSAGALLNLSPDHLDRYESMEEYAQAKFRMKHALKEGAPFFVGNEVKMQWGSAVSSGSAVNEEEGLSMNETFAWKLSGLPLDVFKEKAATFSQLPHRLQCVKKLEGISFYDDSKGTNVAAVQHAIKTLSASVHLILGGRGKNESFLPLIAPEYRIETIYAIGEAKEQIVQELSPHLRVDPVLTLEEAVQKAYAGAKRGDVVLLSPGCSSLDMFVNFEERGRVFQQCVHSLNVKKEEELQYTLF